MANPEPKVETICVGRAEAMIAEVSAFDYRTVDPKAQWFVMPFGNVDWDTEGFRTRADALVQARYLADIYGVRVSRFGF